jgi:hypothetical protein
MACVPAEGYGVHIGDSAIAGNADDDEVDRCGNDDNIESVPKYRIMDAYFRKEGRHLVGRKKVAAPYEDSYKNQNESEDEHSWEK